jgi:hypothetical protein
MNTIIQTGDLVWINKYSRLTTSSLIVSNKQRTQTLLQDFSILGVVVRAHPEMYVVWTIEDEKEHYYYYEDVKLCQDL